MSDASPRIIVLGVNKSMVDLLKRVESRKYVFEKTEKKDAIIFCSIKTRRRFPQGFAREKATAKRKASTAIRLGAVVSYADVSTQSRLDAASQTR